MGQILAKTTIPRERQRWEDFCPISAHCNYEVFFDFPILRLYGNFLKLVFRIILPTSHILVKNDNSEWAPRGRISPRFQPATITMNSRFSNFTALRNFSKTNSPNRHSRRVASCSKTRFFRGRRRWADFCPISARYNYEGFSLFQCYGFTELLRRLFFPNHHFR